MASFGVENVEQHVKVISQQLTEAVETILDQNSSQDKRRQASQFCEEFKNSSTYLTNCGIHLSISSSSSVIKHFGLQLVQHAVKFKWNALSDEEKANLKMIALQFVAMGSGPILEEPPYVKDAIAKLTVEIMKREWPQNWPDVFENLSNISLKGESQLYIVLRILLRLSEEVTTTDADLPSARRKEMTTALSNILEELFKFFIKTLQFNVNKMKEMKIQFGHSENKEVRLAKVLSECVLSTLCGYVGWVSTKYLVQDNRILLELLYLLLQEDDLNMMAAECLELIAGRKGKLVDRKELLILFNVDAIRIMFSSATSAAKSNVDDEKTIAFLKRVCNVLSLLGYLQLASIWGSECDDQGEPAHFNIYVEALLTFYQHKNMLITDSINKVWIAFLRNEDIAKNVTFRSFIPRLLEASKTKLSRASHPANKDLAQSYYSEIDFGSSVEKQTLWTTVRANTREIIQEITTLFPTDTFLQAATWLLKRVKTTQNAAQVQVTETSEEFLEWDSMTIFWHSVLTKLFSNDADSVKGFMSSQVILENTPVNVSQLGKKCIETLINFNKEDLMIMSLVITCLESLLPFLEFTRDLLLPVIHKIFKAISFVSPFSDPSINNQSALEFRRHAGAIWIRLCLTHKKLLIEIIDELTSHIQQMYAQDDFNSQERALLTEGLAIISNGYMNYEKQNEYLGILLAPIKELWMTSEMEQAMSSSEYLVSFVGLDRNGEDNEQCQNNRFHLQVCLRFIHAILKRVEPPKDSQKQINGGFKEKLEDEPLNPVSSLLLPLLSNFFHLIRVLNSIWHPDILAKISPYYKSALEIHEAEKAAIFGLSGDDFEGKLKINKEEKPTGSSVYGMKTFLFKLSEICGLILSDCSRLGQGLYSIPLIGQHLVDYVIQSWKYLPNYRLRILVRNFLKYYCRLCPPSYYPSAIVPVITASFTLIIERLNKEWEKVKGRETFSSFGQTNVEEVEEANEDKSKEVIDDQLVHLLTKNFIETFFAMCTLPRPTYTTPSTEETAEENAKQPNPDDTLQELPKYLLKNYETFQLTLFTPFIALQWPDSSSFVKASKLCIPFIKQVIQCPPSDIAMQPSMFEQLYTLLLKSLQLMGHNVEMQSQILRNAIIIYDTLRPLFPELKNILLQVPNAKADIINQYDKSLFSEAVMSEKQKKKIFKNILGGLIGVPLSFVNE